MWCSSRVSALRRELNSLEASAPQEQHRPHEYVHEQPAPERGHAQSRPLQVHPATAVVCAWEQGSYFAPLHYPEPAHCVGSSEIQSVPRAAVTMVSPAVGQSGRLEYVVRHTRQRGAGSTCCRAPSTAVSWRSHSHCGLSKALPNPSFNPRRTTATGVSPVRASRSIVAHRAYPACLRTRG